MKKIFGVVGVVLLAGFFIFAASKTSVAEADQAKPAVVSKAVWLTSMAAAKAEAAKRKVPILVDFSGSDWCGWCIKLDEEVFSTPVFQEYAAKNLVLLMVDFPRRKTQDADTQKQNNALVEKFGIEGFPTILLLDENEKLIARTSYQPGGGESYVKHLGKLLKNK